MATRCPGLEERNDAALITLQLDEELVRRAEVLASRRGASVSELVAQMLTELVERGAAYEEARDRAIGALMRARLVVDGDGLGTRSTAAEGRGLHECGTRSRPLKVSASLACTEIELWPFRPRFLAVFGRVTFENRGFWASTSV